MQELQNEERKNYQVMHLVISLNPDKNGFPGDT